MAEYGKLLSRIWSDPEFVALEARPQQVYCLLISYSTRNLAGVLPMTLRRWSNSTRDASIDNVTESLAALVANKFLVVDWDTEEVLIRTFIRNDEVYKQPNLMTAARRFALQVESLALKWALSEELSRLPEHKDHGKTLGVANELVKDLTETQREGFAKGLAEPMSKGPGVGGYLSNHQEHQHLHPQPAPAAARVPEPETDPATIAVAATSGAELVHRVIPREHPPATQTALRLRASELVNTGTPPHLVEAALELWLTKPHLGPNTLPSLVSEVIKSRTASVANGFGKPTQKALGIQSAADSLIAGMDRE